MPALKRTQLIIQTWEGDVVTSIQYEFEGVVNEYITVASLQWLLDLADCKMPELLRKHKLITKEKHGMQWVNCADLLPFFGWTPG
jgi:hypothetical protein